MGDLTPRFPCIICDKQASMPWCPDCNGKLTAEDRWYLIGLGGKWSFVSQVLVPKDVAASRRAAYDLGVADREGIELD